MGLRRGTLTAFNLILFGSVSPALAQFASYPSFTVFKQMDAGQRGSMCIDASGNTYVSGVSGSSWYVMKLDPEGSIIYNAARQGNFFPSVVTPGAGGSVWVANGYSGNRLSMWALLDANGNVTRGSYFPSGMTATTITSDSAGNLYIAGTLNSPTSGIGVAKLDPTGNQIGFFQLAAQSNASPAAIAVDSTGSVYVAGNVHQPGTAVLVPDAFPTTPGAYRQSGSAQIALESDVFVMKVEATLDRLAYATLLDGATQSIATSIVVDGAGNAYIGGKSTIVQPTMTPLHFTYIGIPPMPDATYPSGLSNAFVVKVNAQGSEVNYAVSLASGNVNSMAVDSIGRLHAEVAESLNRNVGVFTVSSNGSAVEGAQYVGGDPDTVFPNDANFSPILIALIPGGNGSLRLLMSSQSLNLPAFYVDQPLTPVLIDLAAPRPQADVSISLSLAQPLVIGNGLLDLVATVTNHGPDAADVIQVNPSPQESFIAGVRYCSASGIAVCGVIPHLAAGASATIEYHYEWASVFGLSPISASVRALTSDPNLNNNYATLAVTPVYGFALNFGNSRTPDLSYFRSDAPPWFAAPIGNAAPAASPNLKVWVPSTQTVSGNVWRFKSWTDGNTDNPRVFDATNGVSLNQSWMVFAPERKLGLDPVSLDLVAPPGAAPLAQTLDVYPPTQYAQTVTIGKPGAAWLKVAISAPDPQTGKATVTGIGDTTGMSPGYYRTTFPVTYSGTGTPTPVTVNVNASIRIMAQAPKLDPGGIANLASGLPGSLSPWELISIRGTGLGPPTPVSAVIGDGGVLPRNLGGTTVNGSWGGGEEALPLPLLYVSDREVIAAFPYSFTSAITVSLGGATALTFPQTSAKTDYYSPGIFTRDGSGKGQAVALNANGALNAPYDPALRGSTITLFTTGFATGSQCNPPGGIVPLQKSPTFAGMPSELSGRVEAFIGGKQGIVLSAGSDYGMLCAIQTITFQVPEDSPTGPAVPIRLGVPKVIDPTWYWAQDGVTIAVR